MGCSKPAPTDFRRAGAALEPGGALALDPDQVGGVQADKGHDADQEQHQPQWLGPQGANEVPDGVNHAQNRTALGMYPAPPRWSNRVPPHPGPLPRASPRAREPRSLQACRSLSRRREGGHWILPILVRPVLVITACRGSAKYGCGSAWQHASLKTDRPHRQARYATRRLPLHVTCEFLHIYCSNHGK